MAKVDPGMAWRFPFVIGVSPKQMDGLCRKITQKTRMIWGYPYDLGHLHVNPKRNDAGQVESGQTGTNQVKLVTSQVVWWVSDNRLLCHGRCTTPSQIKSLVMWQGQDESQVARSALPLKKHRDFI